MRDWRKQRDRCKLLDPRIRNKDDLLPNERSSGLIR
jgi:hypothetical protein